MIFFLHISVDCPVGYYPNASDTTQCIACEIGFYKDVTGASACLACDAGFSTVNEGSDDVSLCHGQL